MGLPGPGGVTAEDLDVARAHYARLAPATLGPLARARPRESGPAFKVEHFTPRELTGARLPAVTNVNFVNLSHPRSYDLLVSEMRTRSLMNLTPWTHPEDRELRPLLGDLNYPVHTELIDVNLDGRPDLLTAGIGGMNPSNERRGAAIVSLQDERKRFVSHTAGAELARVADVGAADLDGDMDLDLIVAAFGWRGPGELLVLENRTASWSEPAFSPRTIDERDGFIHAVPADLNRDGHVDLVALLSQEHEEVIAYLNDGRMGFSHRTLYKAEHPAWGFSGIELVDLDRDGDLDVLTSNGDSLDDGILKPYHGVSWLENRGGFEFRNHRIAALCGCARAVAGDVDGDGDLDVVAVSFLPLLRPHEWQDHDLDAVLWIEQQGKDWRAHSVERHRCMHPTVDVADYNQDGRLDIATGNYVWIGDDGVPFLEADYVTLFTQVR